MGLNPGFSRRRLLLAGAPKAPAEPRHTSCTSKHWCPSTVCKYGSAATPPLFHMAVQAHLHHKDLKRIQPRMKLFPPSFTWGLSETSFIAHVDKAGEGSTLFSAGNRKDCLIQDSLCEQQAEKVPIGLISPLISAYTRISQWRKDGPKLRAL